MNRTLSVCVMLGGLVALPAQADWLETFDGANTDNPFMVIGVGIDGNPSEPVVSLTTTGGEGFLESSVAPAGSNGNPFSPPYGAAVIGAFNVTESFTDVNVRGLVNAADIANGDPQRVDHALFARGSLMGGYALVLDVESTLDSLSLVKIMDDLSVTELSTVALRPDPATGLAPELNGELPYYLEFSVIGSMLTGRLLEAIGGQPGNILAEVNASDGMFTSGFSGFGAAADDSQAGLATPLRAGFDNVSSVPAPAAALLLLSGLLLGRFRKR